MSEQYAVITGADVNQIDRTWESAGLSAYETGGKISLSALGRHQYKKEIIGSFKQGSGGRTYRYYSFNNLKHAQQGISVDYYRLPVYGVRGTSEINRSIGYACVYISSSQDMSGLDFYAHVFGSRYLTEEEIRTTSNPEKLTEQAPVMPELTIRSENRARAFAIVERLYQEQKKDPNSKLLIVMDDAETASMDLLKDVYLLLPRKMRLNYGFATNITVKTYEELFQQQSLPIQLLTMDSEVYHSCAERVSAMDSLLSVLDINQITVNHSALHLQMEKLLEKGINPKNDLLFAYAEQEVIKQNNNVPSMQFYPDIISKYLENLGLWWKDSNLKSVEEVERAYAEQQILMEDEALREEAVSSFYLDMIPDGTFAQEIAYMQLGRKGTLSEDLSSKADRCLKFMREKIGYGKILDAVDDVIAWMKQKGEKDVEATKKEYDSQIERLQSDISLRKTQIDGLTEETRKLGQQNKDLAKQNKDLADQNKKLKAERTPDSFGKSSYDRLQEDYDNLQEKYKKQKRAYNDATDSLERKAKAGRILAIVFGALFGLTALVSAVVYMTKIKPEQKEQRLEIEKLQASIETEQGQVISLESELNDCRQQKESAEQQVSTLLSEKELQELKEKEEMTEAEETETESLGETRVLINGYTDANGDFKDDITGNDIASVDENGDGYDDNTGWFIDYERRGNNGSLEDGTGPIRKVTEKAEGEQETRLISTIKDNSIIDLYNLKKAGTISAFDANGDWIDDLSGDTITQPEEGYHEETGWLKGWVDGAKDPQTGERITPVNGMHETDTGAKPICDYNQIKKLNESENEAQESETSAVPALAGETGTAAENVATTGEGSENPNG